MATKTTTAVKKKTPAQVAAAKLARVKKAKAALLKLEVAYRKLDADCMKAKKELDAAITAL